MAWAEAYSQHCQTSKMEHFAGTVNNFDPLTNFAKHSIWIRLWWVPICIIIRFIMTCFSNMHFKYFFKNFNHVPKLWDTAIIIMKFNHESRFILETHRKMFSNENLLIHSTFCANIRCKSPYSARVRENTDQKKLRSRTLFTQWFFCHCQ